MAGAIPSSTSGSGIFLIYKDEGTYGESCRALEEQLSNKFPYRTIKFADSTYLKTAFWEERTALLVLPGGICSVWERNLGDVGMRKIQEYIQVYGGKLLGVCAGGYFVSKHSHFEIGTLKIIKERPFPLFEGQAKGPIKGSSGSPDIAEVVKIYAPSSRAEGGCYYQGGPAFTLMSPDSKTIATYSDPFEGLAIVSLQEGDGTVVASGPHPEFRPPRTRSPCETDAMRDFLDRLTEGESFQSILWDDIIAALFPNLHLEPDSVYGSDVWDYEGDFDWSNLTLLDTGFPEDSDPVQNE